MTSAGGPYFVVIVFAALSAVLYVSEAELLAPSLPEDWEAEDYVEQGTVASLLGSLH